jgi:arylsulfatase A-like enzyme
MRPVQPRRISVGRRGAGRAASVRSAHGPRRRSASIAIAGALLVVFSGCSERAPDPLEVERWVIASAGPTKRLWGERDRCEIGDELRPAVGCPIFLLMSTIGAVATTPHGLSQRYRIAARAYDGKTVLFERRYRPKGGKGPWIDLPPLLVPELAGEMDIEFPLPESAAGGEFDVDADAFVVPPATRTIDTEPVRVAPGSLLEGGIGVDPLSVDAKASPVRFELVARTARGDRTLLDETVDPTSGRARAWIDYRIDLANLAGEEVRFVLITRVLPRPDEAVATDFGMPLWGGARILVRPTEKRPPNVVLISLDTLRADYVGAYGSTLETTPNLDRLAEEGVLFENVVAPYPSTTASHMSMLTGIYPGVHDVLGPTRQLSEELRTLTEVLSAHGYQTAAVTEDGMVSARSGFARGFGFYREFKTWNPAKTDGFVREGVSASLEWLDRHPGERFFLFLHTYQVHGPYAPPEDFKVFSAQGEAAEVARVERDRLLYAGEVLYTDHEIGRFLGGLAERGLADDTIVIVTADHGEAFGEHGALGHGLYLTDEVLRIPLIVRAPGEVPDGLRISAPVSLVDVTPTVLGLVGIPVPEGLQGLSLLPLIADPAAERFRDRILYSQRDRGENSSFAVHRRNRKWLFRHGEEPMVYDLKADPGEDRPLADAELIAEGRRYLDGFRKDNLTKLSRLKEPKARPASIDAATRDKLRRLGYLE